MDGSGHYEAAKEGVLMLKVIGKSRKGNVHWRERFDDSINDLPVVWVGQDGTTYHLRTSHQMTPYTSDDADVIYVADDSEAVPRREFPVCKCGLVMCLLKENGSGRCLRTGELTGR